MREAGNFPTGIKVFTDFLSFSESQNIIDIVESSLETDCGTKWDIPSSHSPDISCFRGNNGFNISQHGFLNSECTCGIKELDAMLGQTMMKALSEYTKEYSLYLSQDEGFSITRQDEGHVDQYVIDDNPFVNRVLSYNVALNVEDPIDYIKFNKFDVSITISKPSIVIFPSNFIYSYSKPKNDGLYEIMNYFNNNPTDDTFETVFGSIE